jgi:NAD(P)-dependent dehydrogenase (short-subunit alcohol dehydrogenase family)
VPTALLSPAGTPATAAVAELLRADGWTVVSTADGPVDALVVDPGLLDEAPVRDAARSLLDLVERTPLRSRDDGGAAVVVVGSRDQLGWGERPEHAAEAAAVFGAARSLALRLAPLGITVNVVAGLPAGDGPAALLPEPATAADLAATVAFFAHPRSRYVTGQLVFCDAGAALLSSFSV